MTSFVKIINHLEQPSSQTADEKKILFETEMSQEPQGQDKQFSPWIRKGIIKESSKPQRYSPHKQNIQFLSSIKQRKSNICTPQSSEQQNQNCLYSHHNLQREFQVKAEQKFKQLIKKSFKQKREFQTQFRLNQKAKHINLNLNWDAMPNLNITPMMKSLEHRTINHSHQQKSQIYNIKKPIKRGSYSHERKLSNTSQQNRLSILKTQQLFYKTLELSLPIQTSKKLTQANFMSRRSPSKKGMTFPSREKMTNRQINSSNKNQESMDYKITGQGINFTSSKGFHRSRRHNLKQTHQIQLQEHQETVFFKI